MAEFCKDCWNKYHKNDPTRNYILSHDLDLCEGCGEFKRIVLCRKNECYYSEYEFLIELPFLILGGLWKIVCCLISLPIKLYRYIKTKKK